MSKFHLKWNFKNVSPKSFINFQTRYGHEASLSYVGSPLQAASTFFLGQMPLLSLLASVCQTVH